MSQQRQLKLVFANSRKPLKIETLSSKRSRGSLEASRASPLMLKVGRLEKELPAEAKVVEKLVDDLLGDERRQQIRKDILGDDYAEEESPTWGWQNH